MDQRRRVLKSGPFKLAIKQQIPVVPITFLDNWRLYPRAGKRGGRPGLARVIVHKPIFTEGLTAEDETMLKNKVYQIVNDPLRSTWGVESSPLANI